MKANHEPELLAPGGEPSTKDGEPSFSYNKADGLAFVNLIILVLSIFTFNNAGDINNQTVDIFPSQEITTGNHSPLTEYQLILSGNTNRL